MLITKRYRGTVITLSKCELTPNTWFGMVRGCTAGAFTKPHDGRWSYDDCLKEAIRLADRIARIESND